MGRGTSPLKFKLEFCRRVKAAREFRRMSQSEVAAELGVEVNTYSTYERRTLLPHHLIPKACATLGVPAEYFFGADAREQQVERSSRKPAGMG